MEMDDLTAWLTQIWDKLEETARAAYYEGQLWLPEEESVITAPDWDVVYTADRKVDARHIVEWQPAIVLARIAADRQILALHRPNGRNILGYPVCDACVPLKPTPCPTVRLLALPYADRPGYREEWKP